MRITRIEYERHDLELTEPYRIAYETIGAATNFILRLETDTGTSGYGCAAPDLVVTGESAAEVKQAIEGVIEPSLLGEAPFRYARILEELRGRLSSASLAMVDCAIYDLLARRADVPLYQLLGGFRSAIPTSITIGILGVKETVARAKRYAAEGFGILKIKGGADVENDIARMRAVRKALPEVRLRFDGNQGYTLEEALHFVGSVQLLDLEILEQPTSTKEESVMGRVTKDSPIAVMADESLKTLNDAFRLSRHELTDMINIKLQKVGGIWPALHINSVAKSAGNEVMIGCLDECGLGIAAGLHFALSRPNIKYADLDGNLDFVRDPYGHMLRLDRGVLYPVEGPGLGRVI